MPGKRKRDTPDATDTLTLVAIEDSDASHSEASTRSTKVFTNAELAQGVETMVHVISPWNTSFLIKLTVDNASYLRIWAEDRASKKQWQTDKLAVTDFVGENAALPGASVTDYASCFINCLNVRSDQEKQVKIVQSDGDDGDLELHLGMKVRVFASEWNPKYAFLLKHITLEPVDRVFAKLRDHEKLIQEQDAKIVALEDEVRKLKQQAALTSTTSCSVGVVGTMAVPKDHYLQWQIVDVSGPVSLVSGVQITFDTTGVFVIQVTVAHGNTIAGVVFDLHLNDKTIASGIDTAITDFSKSTVRSITTLTHVLQITCKDTLAIAYRGNHSTFKESCLIAYELR